MLQMASIKSIETRRVQRLCRASVWTNLASNSSNHTPVSLQGSSVSREASLVPKLRLPALANTSKSKTGLRRGRHRMAGTKIK